MTIKKRNIPIDILRIMAIIFVITGHFMIHNSSFHTELIVKGNVSYFPNAALYSVLILGVNVFLLISGYFGIHSYKKFFYFLSATYTVAVITSIFCITMRIPYTIKFMLFLFSTFWFIGVYLVLLLFAPIINKSVDLIDKREFYIFISTYLIVWGIQDTFANTGYIAMNNGYSIFHAIAMLFVGGGIRKFQIEKSCSRWGIFLFIFSLVLENTLFLVFCDHDCYNRSKIERSCT